MGKFGTLSALEDWATDNGAVSGREDEIAAAFRAALDAYNKITAEMLSDLAGVTDQAQLAYPAADEAMIQELDEWGAADASKPALLGEVGFPLRIYGGTVQWTNTYLERATPALMAATLDAFAAADLRNLRRLLALALFKNTNTTGYLDRLGTKRSYDLKALLNADGQAVPPSPSGATFDGATHTHPTGIVATRSGRNKTSSSHVGGSGAMIPRSRTELDASAPRRRWRRSSSEPGSVLHRSYAREVGE